MRHSKTHRFVLAAFAFATGILFAPLASAQTPPPTTATPDVTGTIVGPDGKPVEGAAVAVFPVAANGRDLLAAVSGKTDAAGSFAIDGHKLWSGPGQFAAVLITAPGLAVDGALAARAQPTPIDVTLTAPCAVTIRLHDEYDQPVAGVSIVVSTFDHEQSGTQLSFGVPKPSQGIVTATTASDGTATFTNLPQGWTVYFECADPRYALSSQAHFDVPSAAKSEAPAMEAFHAAEIDGFVYGSDGKPMPGLDVWAENTSVNGEPFADVPTGPDGRYMLAHLLPGAYTVFMQLPDPLKRTVTVHPVRNIVLGPSGHRHDLDLRLVQGAVLTGKVTYAGTTEPAKDASIFVEDTAPGPFSVLGASPDATGRYTICVPGGAYRVSAFGDTAADNTPVTVEDGGTREIDFAVNRIKPNPVLEGMVVGSSGDPVAGADVVASDGWQSQSTKSAADGTFTIPVSPDALAVLRAHLGASATTNPTAGIPGSKLVLRLTENAFGKIAGTVIDAAGGPISGAQVTVSQYDGSAAAQVGATTTDPQGRYSFDGLWPDPRYMVTAKADGFVDASLDTVLLRRGQTTTVAPFALVRADSFIGGIVLDATGKPMVGVQVYVGPGATRIATTDGGGRFHVDHLPSGEVDIDAQSGDEVAAFQTASSGSDNVTVRMHRRPSPPAGVDRPSLAAPTSAGHPQVPEIQAAGWLSGAPVTLAKLRGHIVLLDIFLGNTDTLHETQSVAAMLADKGVVAVGMDSGANADPQTLPAHFAQEGVTMPVALDIGASTGIGNTARALGARSEENYIVIDSEGRIVSRDFDLGDAGKSILGLIEGGR